MLHHYTEDFSASYTIARARFRAAVSKAGGTLNSYEHPACRGVEGEVLTIDVGRVGNIRSPRQMLMISATHGLEGFAGAALQVAWLRSQMNAKVLRETGFVLVHGLNPYGFSHGTRTTHEGVDLNRNFLDYGSALPANDLYGEVHPHLVASMTDQHAWTQAENAIARLRTSVGDDALFDAIARGQYSHADGVFYGGTSPTWENRTLEEIVHRYLGHASKVAVIDWHTGIGAYGEPFFLAFAEEGSEEQLQTAKWWGNDNVLGVRVNGRSRPRYRGLVFDGIKNFIPHAQVAGGVIEWGTRGPVAGELAVRQDLFLRRHRERLSADTYAQARMDLLDSLNPVSYVWRTAVLSAGMKITNATADGLTHW